MTVADTTAPVVTPPADVTAEATSADGALVEFPLAVASDVADPSPLVECSRTSGTPFPLGATTVTCTATDAAGNTGTASFIVTVVDTTAPVMTHPADITAEATSPDGAVVD